MQPSDRATRVDATPHAAALIESLRDIGYSLETAVADIIDNSITAGARTVRILSDTDCDDPEIAIIDDGNGMSRDELVAAMRPGSQNPLASRDASDLGRFGLGLKSASFSQCRRLTVVTRKDGNLSAAIWDLDDVAERNEWTVDLLEDSSDLAVRLELGEHGTAVIWQKLDRLAAGMANNSRRRSEVINAKIAETEHHLRLVFHRFMNGSKALSIKLNGRQLKPLDPFARKKSATIADPEELFPFAHGEITIQSFTLPHHSQMNDREWDDIGGPEGHLKTQGFYLYRGDRLIVYGTWFGLCRQSELTKLSRVRIDIPNSMDADWKIDVKKSSAQLPPEVRDRLKKVIERIRDGSRRTYRRRGEKLVDQERLPFWHRQQADGHIRYRPNLEHPAFAKFTETLPDQYRRGFLNCLTLLGASLPVETLHADMAGTAEQIVPDTMDDDALTQAVQFTLSTLQGAGKEPDEIKQMMREVDPFRSSWDRTQKILTEMSN